MHLATATPKASPPMIRSASISPNMLLRVFLALCFLFELFPWRFLPTDTWSASSQTGQTILQASKLFNVL